MHISDEQISGKVLDHLGLVAATIDKLGLVEKINRRLPVSEIKGSKVSMGHRAAAMILNGLGFMDDRLYLFPDFLKNKPVERLLGEGLTAEDFNDDALGRFLDSVYEYGITKLFSDIAFEIGIEQKLLGKSAHFDTTSLSLEGDYAECEAVETQATRWGEQTKQAKADANHPVPSYGYSKAHRPDLKQMVATLATTGSSGFPVWMESHSGNASDKTVLHEAAERMQALSQSIQASPHFLYVADSAMYESCLKKAGNLLWLSRVPATHQITKMYLQRPDDAFDWITLPDGYKVCVIETPYQKVQQRFAIVHSEHACAREKKTLKQRIQKEAEEAKKLLWHLGNQVFQCEQDAQKAAVEETKRLKYHAVNIQVVPIQKHAKRGRPSKGDAPVTQGYQIQSVLTQDEHKIEKIQREKGRFILATNQLDRTALPDEAILSEYKEQSKTESGFRFIKDDTFEVDSVFLKKPERIAALMMIMTLCLMVYAVAQHQLRETLKATDDTIPNQLKKETNQPTMKWVYRLFHGIQVITLRLAETSQQLVINLNELTRRIVRYFGERAMWIYGLTA